MRGGNVQAQTLVVDLSPTVNPSEALFGTETATPEGQQALS